MEIAKRLQPDARIIERLQLAGAPTDTEALRAHLEERFAIRLTTAALRTMAAVPPEMLIPPAERGRTKGRT